MASGSVISRSSVPVTRSRSIVTEVTTNIETNGKRPSTGRRRGRRRPGCPRRPSARRSRAARGRGGSARSCAGRGGAGEHASRRAPTSCSGSRSSSIGPEERGIEVAGAGARADLGRRPWARMRAVAEEHEARRSARPRPSRGSRRAGSRPRRRGVWNRSQRSRRRTGSSPTVGSSRTRSSGSPASAAARETRARSPPERVATTWVAWCSRPTWRSPAGASRRARRGCARSSSGSRAPEVAVDRGRLGDVGDAAAQLRRAGGLAEDGDVARSTRCTPTTARISVVLPLPLGPSSPVTAPAGRRARRRAGRACRLG